MVMQPEAICYSVVTASSIETSLPLLYTDFLSEPRGRMLPFRTDFVAGILEELPHQCHNPRLHFPGEDIKRSRCSRIERTAGQDTGRRDAASASIPTPVLSCREVTSTAQKD
jgi:hypothetical protein